MIVLGLINGYIMNMYCSLRYRPLVDGSQARENISNNSDVDMTDI